MPALWSWSCGAAPGLTHRLQPPRRRLPPRKALSRGRPRLNQTADLRVEAVEGGCRLFFEETNGRLAQLGFLPGDVVVSADGRALVREEDVVRMLKQACRTGAEVEVLRGEERLKLQLAPESPGGI